MPYEVNIGKLASEVANHSSQLADMTTKQGDLTQLNTTDKSSVVNALKEIKTQANNNLNTISSVGSGSPKGVYLSLSALQAAFPTGTTGIYLVTADGKWYFWNGSAWTAGGTYQSTGIADKSVTYVSVNDNIGDGLARPYNLCDKTTLTTGGYLGANGTVVSGNYQYTDFIPVEVGKTYCFYGAFSTTYQAVAYDINKNFVANIYTTNLSGAAHNYTYTVPAGTYFIRFNMGNSGDLYTMVVEGTTYPSTYTAYAPMLVSNKLSQGIKNTLSSIGLNDKSILPNMLATNAGDGLVQMYNYCDYTKLTKDSYLGANGVVVSSTNYAYSDYIPVTVGVTYCWWGAFSISYQAVAYDSSKNFIKNIYTTDLGGASHSYTYTPTAGIAYIRFNMGVTQANTMVIQGTTYPSTYTPYGYAMLSSSLSTGMYNSLGLNVLYTDSNYNTTIGQLNLTNKNNTMYATAIGYGALKNNTTDGSVDAGLYNTAVGYQAMMNNTIGNHNTAVGWESSLSLTIGTGNTSVGQDSLLQETTGVGNTVLGQRAMQQSNGANTNTAIGNSAMYWDSNSMVTGTDNTAVGHYAGSRISSDTDLTLIGHFANKDSSANNYVDSTALGANAIVNKSHQVMIGSTSVTEVDTYGDFQCLTSGKGLILTSPGGKKYKLTISDAGTLAIALV